MKCAECGREGPAGECPVCGHWNNDTIGGMVMTVDAMANLLGVEAPFKVGDRVESTAGDDRGMRGFVTKVDFEDQTPIHWTADGGSKVRCIADRVRRAPPNPAGWVPSCGDRVRVLTGDQKSRSAFVVNTERPGRTFVALLARAGAVAGPYVDNALELVAPARGPLPSESSAAPGGDDRG